MRSRLLCLVVLTTLAACDVEGPGKRRQATGTVSAAPRQAPQPAPLPEVAVMPPETASSVEHQVFDRRLEEVAPGVARLTLSVIIPRDEGEAGARAAMETIAESARRHDSTVAAIRVLAYEPPRRGHELGSVPLVPLAFLEWLPPGGWDGLRAQSRRQPHRMNVVFAHGTTTPQRPSGVRRPN